jgi:hypothetical protein
MPCRLGALEQLDADQACDERRRRGDRRDDLPRDLLRAVPIGRRDAENTQHEATAD